MPKRDLLDYSTIDPGIRKLVRLLREEGFDTCDSGDGTSTLGCAPGQPNVAGKLATNNMARHGQHIFGLLAEYGVDLQPQHPDLPWVQISYDPATDSADYLLMGVRDDMLRFMPEPACVDFRPRGIGFGGGPCFLNPQGEDNRDTMTDCSCFVPNKQSGDWVLRWFAAHDMVARLDWRYYERAWCQVKIQACEQHVDHLEHFINAIAPLRSISPDFLRVWRNGIERIKPIPLCGRKPKEDAHA